MKHALKVVGRFAVWGWASFTGATIAFVFICALIERHIDADTFLWGAVFGFLWGLAGAVGGAVLALIVLGLERLNKRPAANPAAGADESAPDPAVWPPAPKPPA